MGDFESRAAEGWARVEGAVAALLEASAAGGAIDAHKAEVSAACEALAALYKPRPHAEREASMQRLRGMLLGLLVRRAEDDVRWRAILEEAPTLTEATLPLRTPAVGMEIARLVREGGHGARGLLRAWVDRLASGPRAGMEEGFDARADAFEAALGRAVAGGAVAAAEAARIWAEATPEQAEALEALLGDAEGDAPTCAVDDARWRAFLAATRRVEPATMERLQAELGTHVGRLMDAGHDVRVLLIEWVWSERIEHLAGTILDVRRRSRGSGGAAWVEGQYASARAEASPDVRAVADAHITRTRQERRRAERLARKRAQS